MLAFGDSCIQNLNGQQRKYFQPYQNNWKYTKCKSLLCLQNGGQCNMQFRYLTQRLCSIQYLRNGNHPDLYSCRLFLTYFECTKNLKEPSAHGFFWVKCSYSNRPTGCSFSSKKNWENYASSILVNTCLQ